MGRTVAAPASPRRPRAVVGGTDAEPVRARSGEPAGWVVLRSDTNYRSPTNILAQIDPLLPRPTRSPPTARWQARK
jgi:hypothetical protein